ncbi:hypothetical protein COCC4DRAFT_122353 [Bipolaris maydis ATCC 48331]|uniref:Uncharacterized protein n=1 Tax=Cochliobolus heterostrophus (strain C4 / ATCC 48331 / race T) TaxID=665024 RepID=N4XQG4_COCH4|nr:uncharacterized protein COCC4DRAFT_122353 [Bipolaris maydis ATCC 48331]ENI10898.1 hypothetical protein COCC4DRAFT_122353 [Bipolaris maydis ATCC 48331]
MLTFFAPLLLLAQSAAAAPVENVAVAAAATVGKIRGVRDPIYHLYLQASPKNSSKPVLGPESAAEEFTIGGTIQSKKTNQFLNIATASTSYKPLVWGAKGDTTAWGLEGDTIITTQGKLNFLACNSADAGYYDLFLQTGSDAPSGKTCSNYQTIHLPCLC